MTTELLMSKPRKIVFAGKTAKTSSFCINYEKEGCTTWAIADIEDSHGYFYDDTRLFPLSTVRVKLSDISLNVTERIEGRVSCQISELGRSCVVTNYCYLYRLNNGYSVLYMPFWDLLYNNLTLAKTLLTIHLN